MPNAHAAIDALDPQAILDCERVVHLPARGRNNNGRHLSNSISEFRSNLFLAARLALANTPVERDALAHRTRELTGR